MDMPAAGEEPMKGSQPPDLMTSAELQNVLDTWRLSGEPPFPELRTGDRTYWTGFSTIDLRLVHHIVALSIDLQRRGYGTCTPWSAKMPMYVLEQSPGHVFAANACVAQINRCGADQLLRDERPPRFVRFASGLADAESRHREPGILPPRRRAQRAARSHRRLFAGQFRGDFGRVDATLVASN